MVILLAGLAAFSFAAGSVTAKRGMQNTNVVTALIISSAVAAAVLAVAVGFNPPTEVSAKAIWLFAAAGLIGDGVGRFSMLGAVDRLGPSIAIPIQTAAYPLIAVIGGVVVLAETVTFGQLVGVAGVVVGIWVLLGPGSEPQDPLDRAGSTRRAGRGSSLLLPVLAGVGFAVSDLFRKSGLREIPDPAFGALVAVTTMLLLLVGTATAVPRIRRQIRVGAGWGWLVAAGAFIAAALLTLFQALEGGAVSAVGPIIAAQPVAVVGLSWLLLHTIERVTSRMVVGAAIVVIGVILIALAA